MCSGFSGIKGHRPGPPLSPSESRRPFYAEPSNGSLKALTNNNNNTDHCGYHHRRRNNMLSQKSTTDHSQT
eukprot:6446658-Heterocapsa_arctica.AAC.1